MRRLLRRLLATGLLFAPATGCAADDPPREPATAADRWTARREAMVEYQIARRGLDDPRLLAALRHVPRHELVPERYRDLAYTDRPLPIGEGQTISQPYVVAYMTNTLGLTGEERVLEVGTGSGYQAAILAEMAAAVFTIEIVPGLAARAAADLERLGYGNVVVREGDGYRGWPEEAPFDAIIVTAAPDHVPPALVEQLAPEGRMILPLGEGSQRLLLVTCDADGAIHREELLGVRFVPMTGEAERDREEP